MNQKYISLLFFLLVNFGGLALGGYFTGKGVPSDWYQSLNKAPWTPPGWVFGAAWSLIMICFSVYLAQGWEKLTNKNIFLGFFVILWVLNVGWNPVFFYFQNTGFGLLIISSLFVLLAYFSFKNYPTLKWEVYLLLPYLLWLIIATSLNAYIYLKN